MKYQPALEEGELHSLNLRSIRTWIDANKGKIKAKPNKSVFYAGRDYDLEVIPDLPLADRKEFMGTPMYKRIEEVRGRIRDLELPLGFQTLEDVLKTIRDHPKLLDRDRQEQKFSNAFDFFHNAESFSKLLPDSRKVSRESWERLSELFATNAEGDIRVLDGCADDYGKLSKDKILLRKELETLLRNSKLSADGKALLVKKISKYGALFDRRYTELLKFVGEGKKRLVAKP